MTESGEIQPDTYTEKLKLVLHEALESLDKKEIMNIFGVKEAIDTIGVKETIDTIGVKETIDTIGVKETIDTIGVKEAIDTIGVKEAIGCHHRIHREVRRQETCCREQTEISADQEMISS